MFVVFLVIRVSKECDPGMYNHACGCGEEGRLGFSGEVCRARVSPFAPGNYTCTPIDPSPRTTHIFGHRESLQYIEAI